MTPSTAIGAISPVIRNLTFFSETGASGTGSSASFIVSAKPTSTTSRALCAGSTDVPRLLHPADEPRGAGGRGMAETMHEAGSSEILTCPPTRPASPLDGYVSPTKILRMVRKYGVMADDRRASHSIKPGVCYFVRYQTSTLPTPKSLTLFENVNSDYSSAHESPTVFKFVNDEVLPYDFSLTIGGEVYFDTDKNITLWHYKSGNYGARATEPESNPGFPPDKFVHFNVIDALDKYAKIYKLDSYLHLLLKPTELLPYLWNPIGDAFCERITSVTSEAEQMVVVQALISAYIAFGKLPLTEREQLELADAFRAATHEITKTHAISSTSETPSTDSRGSPPSLIGATSGY